MGCNPVPVKLRPLESELSVTRYGYINIQANNLQSPKIKSYIP